MKLKLCPLFFLITGILFYTSCNYLYTPIGISGKDAKKEIEKEIDGISLILLAASLSSSDSSSSTVTTVCKLKNPIPNLPGTDTGPGNFDIPKVGKTVDLESTGIGNNSYFRSKPASDNFTNIEIKTLITSSSRTPASECYFLKGDSYCTGTGLQFLNIAFDPEKILIKSNPKNRGTIFDMSVGECIVIQCGNHNGLHAIRLNNHGESFGDQSSSSINSDEILIFLLGPEIEKEIRGIEDNKYYKRDSLENCKRSVSDIVLLSYFDQQSHNNRQYIKYDCNLPAPRSRSTNILASYIARGNACKLEEVNPLGF